MTETDKSAAAVPEAGYNVLSVEAVEAPDGGVASDWFRYVIEVPGGALTGMRRGNRRDVLEFAREYATQLRARASHKAKQPYMRGRHPAAATAPEKKR